MTGYLPQLAESLNPKQLDLFYDDTNWAMSQKVDGHRVMSLVDNGGVTFLNRHGTPIHVKIPPALREEHLSLPGKWLLDGEFLPEDGYWVFDLLIAGDRELDEYSFRDRMKFLADTVASLHPRCTKLLPNQWAANGKHALVDAVHKNHGEGVMLKKIDAPYHFGKRHNSWLKAKFRKQADVVIIDKGRDGKDNLAMGMFNEQGQLVEVGEITALAGDGPHLRVGDVATVTYLYCADPAKPRLFQPTLPMKRLDKNPEECTIDQLVYTDKSTITL